MMKAGRELDALVAEKVMGYRLIYPEEQKQITNGGCVGEPLIGCYVDGQTQYYLKPPLYSTSITDAWLVVEKLRRGEAFVTLYGLDEEHVPVWKCEIMDYKGYSHVAQSEDSPCLAICLAALKAVGYDESH